MFNWGALCFGLVVGWITYRTMRRTQTSGLSDIATVIGAVGGAAVLSLFPAKSDGFGTYSIGLAIGFFAYLIVAGVVEVKAAKNSALKPINKWLGSEPDETTPTARRQSGGNPGA
jgi:uncharacterized membrane protein YeaQ/YmgE (transglycosylase-associated protein family)